MRSLTRVGINIFLDGKIPTENLRFREESLHFKIADSAEEFLVEKNRRYQYPSMQKTLGKFKLNVEEGSFTDSEIIVMLGENGTGKTTFVKLLAGKIDPDDENDKMHLNVSMKPQTIAPKFPGTVRELLMKQIRPAFMHAQFNTDVLKPMQLEVVMDQFVTTLSGGELQRVAIVLCLGKSADIYLIDEPSAYLDSEQRIIAARVIKRYVYPSALHVLISRQIHPARQEDGVRGRARYRDGHVSRRPSCGLFGHSLRRGLCRSVSHARPLD